jgi:hypothetical protein
VFKIEYETEALGSRWLVTQYPDPDDADQIAKKLVAASDGTILRATVVEQAGYVYSEWVRA